MKKVTHINFPKEFNNCIISKLNIQDLPQIKSLQQPTWSDIIPICQFYLNSDFCFVVKAMINQQLVGMGAIIFHQNVAWLANIIVGDDFRNRGIGSTITQFLIDSFKDESPNMLLFATIYGKPLYQKLGFEPMADYLFFKAGKLNLPLSTKLIPYSSNFKIDILQLDEKIMDEKRSILLEPHLKNSFLYVNNGKLEGCFFAGLGEGLIIANNASAGIELLKLSLLQERKPIIPIENTAAIQFLSENGFEINEKREGAKMYLGQKPNWNPKGQFARIGGNLG